MQKSLLLVVGIMSVVLSLLGCSEEDGMPLQPQTLSLSAPSKVDYSIDWAFADQDGRNEAILIEAEKDEGRYYCLDYLCVGYEGQCKW